MKSECTAKLVMNQTVMTSDIAACARRPGWLPALGLLVLMAVGVGAIPAFGALGFRWLIEYYNGLFFGQSYLFLIRAMSFFTHGGNREF